MIYICIQLHFFSEIAPFKEKLLAQLGQWMRTKLSQYFFR